MGIVVIGIHGLGNKPPAPVLQSWWREALDEGLRLAKKPPRRLDFQLVYWADILNARPLDPLAENPRDPLFLKQPYAPSSGGVPEKSAPSAGTASLDRTRSQLTHQIKRIFTDNNGNPGLEGISDLVIRLFVKDLDVYYRSGRRDDFCERLGETLKKNRRKKIFLIAHSMGSIIALDTLSRYVPDVKVHTLLTIGSPLGVPLIKERLLGSGEGEAAGGSRSPRRTPENITKGWFNFSDYRDRVALDYRLRDDFLPNSRGVAPVDRIVTNDYEYAGERNFHKSYGYLRCRETAEILNRLYSPFRFFLF